MKDFTNEYTVQGKKFTELASAELHARKLMNEGYIQVPINKNKALLEVFYKKENGEITVHKIKGVSYE